MWGKHVLSANRLIIVVSSIISFHSNVGAIAHFRSASPTPIMDQRLIGTRNIAKNAPSLLSTGNKRKLQNVWQQTGSDIDGDTTVDSFGRSVALSGDGQFLVVGAPRSSGNGIQSGQAKVYQFDGGWSQVGSDINGENANDLSGNSVAISEQGNIIAIGAPQNDANNGNLNGHVRVYELNEVSNSWTQMGDDIDGEDSGDQSGGSVALSADGKIVAIGAIYNENNISPYSGHTRVYGFDDNNGVWNQIGQDIDGDVERGFSGAAVALSADGNVVAIGAYGFTGVGNPGDTKVFAIICTTWEQVGETIFGENPDDKAGRSIALSADGRIIAIGADLNDDNSDSSGHTRVYSFDGSDWIQLGDDIDGENEEDNSGYSVSLSADGYTVAIASRLQNFYGEARIYALNCNSNPFFWEKVGDNISGDTFGIATGSVSLSSDGKTIAIGFDFISKVVVYSRDDSSTGCTGATPSGQLWASCEPSSQPSQTPSQAPSISPSETPSRIPSFQPSISPAPTISTTTSSDATIIAAVVISFVVLCLICITLPFTAPFLLSIYLVIILAALALLGVFAAGRVPAGFAQNVPGIAGFVLDLSAQ